MACHFTLQTQFTESMVHTQRYGVQPISNDGRVATSTALPTVLNTYPGADYILDVKTYKWGYVYFPLNWGTYRSMYGARMRLINASDGKIEAEGSCKYATPYSRDDPGYDELFANNAKKLKSMLHAQAEKCVTKFETKVLDIGATGAESTQ